MRHGLWARMAGLALAIAACAPAPHTVVGKTVSPAFDVQGHRGARGLQPENTLPAVETALDAGVSTLELDLHLTRDEALVIWHDPVLSADKCDGPGLADGRAVRIRELRYKQLGDYTCPHNPDPARFPDQRATPTAIVGDDYRIVRLEVLLDFLRAYADSGVKTRAQRENAASVRLNLELKRVEAEPWRIADGFDGTHPATFEKTLIDLIRARDLVDRVTVQSFDHRSLAAIHSVAPEIVLAALTTDRADLAAIRRLGASVWSPQHETLTRARVDEAHSLGLRVVPWTVNSAARIAALIDMGVDGIITDLGSDVSFSRLGRAR